MTDAEKCAQDLLMHGACFRLNGKHVPVADIFKKENTLMTNVEFAVENRELNEAYAVLLGQALKYMSQWQYDKLVKDRTWHTRLLEHHYYERKPR